MRVLKPLEENKNAMFFVTEEINGSLANFLGDDTNLSELPDSIKNYKFSDLESRFCLINIIEAILFMHKDAKMYHLHVDPCNIYVTPKKEWKLFGFYFSQYIAHEGESVDCNWDYTKEENLMYTKIPTFQCISPEIVIQNAAMSKSDAFSLGRVAYFINRHNSGVRPDKPILELEHFRQYVRSFLHSFHNQTINQSIQIAPFVIFFLI